MHHKRVCAQMSRISAYTVGFCLSVGLWCAQWHNMVANISVHIAVKGYVGAVTPTGKDRTVLLATF